MSDEGKDCVDIAAVEGRLLASLDRRPWPAEEAVADLNELLGRGEGEKAAAASELLLDSLLDTVDGADLMPLLGWISGHGPAGALAGRAGALVDFFRKRGDNLAAAMAEIAGFDVRSATDAMRRFKVLSGLKPGAFCRDGTWGFGTVVVADAFYKTVTVDFEKKKAHRMSLAYACDSLGIIGAGHFLAVKHREPERLVRMAKENPGDLVVFALESLGPMSVPQIQELLVGDIVKSEDWKKTWETARKALRGNPRIRMPSARSGPILLSAAGVDAADAAIAALAMERDPAEILGQVERVVREKKTPGGVEKFAEAARERLTFIFKMAGVVGPAQTARAVAAWRKLELGDAPEFGGACAGLRRVEAIGAAAERLSSRAFSVLLAALSADMGEETAALVKESLPVLGPEAFSTAVSFLLARGAESEVAGLMRELFARSAACEGLLPWLAANIDYASDKGIASPKEIVFDCLALLGDSSASGARLKARNMAKSCFDRAEWRNRVLNSLDDAGRREFIRRLKDSSAWPSADLRSLLARIVDERPELAGELADSAPEYSRPQRVTSHRTYRGRQEQLRELLSVEIPRNSRDIATARSYGDLRENFEYKAAKEMQELLMRRSAELQQMLTDVKPADFPVKNADMVDVGTEVELRREGGAPEVVRILGEWDGEEKLNIISCCTALAMALLGRRRGDNAVIPSESGSETCLIQDIRPLPPEVVAWAKGEAF